MNLKKEEISFALPGSESWANGIASRLGMDQGELTVRHFPDGETYVRTLTPVAGKRVNIICCLEQPDVKVLPLYFLAQSLKEQGAAHIRLIVPYLPYMRQDQQFHTGEAVTAVSFAKLLSLCADELITIDPHLHRIQHLEDIYSCRCHTLHAASPIAEWVRANVDNPVIIGPDSESKQWVSALAAQVGAPFIVLEKERLGDKQVHVHLNDADLHKERTPVLVDDIISTAHTMIEASHLLILQGLKPPICIGIHGLFTHGAWERLLHAGVGKVVTCNTITHPTNAIDLTNLVCGKLSELS